MSVYWNFEDIEREKRDKRRRRMEIVLITGTALCLLWWSPVWLLPTQLGLLLTLTLYMLLGFVALWLVVKRLNLQTRTSNNPPFLLLFLVTVYLSAVALTVTPIMTMMSSGEFTCTHYDRYTLHEHTCTGQDVRNNATWEVSGQSIKHLPLVWVTDREFENGIR